MERTLMDDGPFGGIRYDGTEPEAGWGPPPVLKPKPRTIATEPYPGKITDEFPTFMVWFCTALGFLVGLFIGLMWGAS